jgi:hypothetical protein
MTEPCQSVPVLTLRIVSTSTQPWQAVLIAQDASELRFDSPLELAQHLARLVQQQPKRQGLK